MTSTSGGPFAPWLVAELGDSLARASQRGLQTERRDFLMLRGFPRGPVADRWQRPTLHVPGSAL